MLAPLRGTTLLLALCAYSACPVTSNESTRLLICSRCHAGTELKGGLQGGGKGRLRVRDCTNNTAERGGGKRQGEKYTGWGYFTKEKRREVARQRMITDMKNLQYKVQKIQYGKNGMGYRCGFP